MLLGRAARWYAAHDRALDAVRAACAARDWDHAGDVLAGSAVGILMSDGVQPLEFGARALPGRPGRGGGRRRRMGQRAAVERGRRGHGGVPGGCRPLGGALGRCHPPGGRAGPGRAADPGRGRAAAPRPGAHPLAAWALAGPAQEGRHPGGAPCGRPALVRAWLASLHCWDIAAAARALRHADRQLSGGLDLLRARARAWRALVLACAGELTAAELRRGRSGTHVHSGAYPRRRPASLAALARGGAGEPGQGRSARGAATA